MYPKDTSCGQLHINSASRSSKEMLRDPRRTHVAQVEESTSLLSVPGWGSCTVRPCGRQDHVAEARTDPRAVGHPRRVDIPFTDKLPIGAVLDDSGSPPDEGEDVARAVCQEAICFPAVAAVAGDERPPVEYAARCGVKVICPYALPNVRVKRTSCCIVGGGGDKSNLH